MQKENPPYPKEAEMESPNLSNLKFDEMTLGVPTPTTPRKNLVSSQAIDVDQSNQGTIRRSYNRLVEPIPPRSSLRQKKLEEFYSMSGRLKTNFKLSFLQKLRAEFTYNFLLIIELLSGGRQRSISIGGRSLIGDSLGGSHGHSGDTQADDDELDSFVSSNYTGIVSV